MWTTFCPMHCITCCFRIQDSGTAHYYYSNISRASLLPSHLASNSKKMIPLGLTACLPPPHPRMCISSYGWHSKVAQTGWLNTAMYLLKDLEAVIQLSAEPLPTLKALEKNPSPFFLVSWSCQESLNSPLPVDPSLQFASLSPLVFSTHLVCILSPVLIDWI